MKAIFIAFAIVLALPYCVQTSEVPGQKEVRVQKTGLTRDEEFHLGEQAAARIDGKIKPVHNSDLEQWLSQVGGKLGGTPEAREYPYRFKLVDDPAISATAFPGGLVYVNTGLLAGANNESEVAGVLAHEMSHVALRHGAAKETKSHEWKTALQVAGLAAGIAGVPMAGPAIGMGGDAGVKAAMSGKYSREAERDADLNGARMMAAAGYNPEALAHFLARQGQSGATLKSKWDHGQNDVSDNAKRVELIHNDMRFYTAKAYDGETGRFAEIQATVNHLGKPSGFIAVGGTR